MIVTSPRIYWVNVYPHGVGGMTFYSQYEARLEAKGMALYRIKIILK